MNFSFYETIATRSLHRIKQMFFRITQTADAAADILKFCTSIQQR
jgi:hypothetical protein